MVTYLEMQRVKYIFPAAQKQVGVIAYKQHLNINKTYECVHRQPVKNTCMCIKKTELNQA